MRPQLDVDGPAAPPRRNGELVFAEPWESRAFGLVCTLCDRGALDWEEFRQHLIAAVAERERSGEPWSYYACWLEALEGLTDARGLATTAEVEHRAQVLAAHDDHH